MNFRKHQRKSISTLFLISIYSVLFSMVTVDLSMHQSKLQEKELCQSKVSFRVMLKFFFLPIVNIVIPILLLAFTSSLHAQCPAGSEPFDWTDVNPYPWDETTTPMASFTTTTCAISNTSNFSLEDPDGILNNSETGPQADGRYYFSIIDVTAGDEARMEITFGTAIYLNDFRVDDVDWGNTFTDIVEFSASIGGTNVPLTLS
ncbi:MAG: hypothetical protein GY705_09210, partial [Bacteroidetes bacterium]|nr:hypothetical protein [Bacteroidota bacterium]